MGENIMQYMRAFYGFWSILFAVIRGRVSRSPLSLDAVPIQAKTSSSRIPLDSTTKQRSDFTGFFAPIECRASSDISGPTMRGCRKEYRNYAGVMPAPLQRIYRLGFGSPQYTQCDYGSQFWL